MNAARSHITAGVVCLYLVRPLIHVAMTPEIDPAPRWCPSDRVRIGTRRPSPSSRSMYYTGAWSFRDTIEAAWKLFSPGPYFGVLTFWERDAWGLAICIIVFLKTAP